MKEQDYNVIIQQRLKKLRELKELDQIDIAAIIEKGRTTYCQYENGQRKITINNLCKIADEFNLPLDWFTGRDTETDKKIKYN